ncbi:mandelate racemase/muconate lactonizing enzyme family protein [Dactylosporangium sp. NPDC050688]|uniref:mandelate racemase/muconate lactonizing enzyme family protein n=1 Tax=Dactylosporangium sp. NPDC050688 TaxID=3157217 RepID=UPI0033DE0FCD
MGSVELAERQPNTLGPLDTPIRSVAARALWVPFRKPIVTPNYQISGIDTIVVRVVDADGATGYGYLWCVLESQVPVLIEALRCLARCVRDASPASIGAVHARLRNDVNFLGLKGVGVFALSALDMAVHDLRCRRLGLSLGKLLGRVRDRVPVYWSGLMLTENDDDLVREAEELVSRGFRACKIRVGRNSIEEDARRIALIREHTPANMTLMLDAVQYYTPQEALRACRRFAEFSPHWLEEPVVHNDYAALRHIVSKAQVPIAGGENEYLPEGFRELLDTGLDYLLVDLERVGGITGWLETASLTATGVTVMTPHVYPHVCVQLGSASQARETWVEYMPWWDELMTYELTVDDGQMVVPDIAGIGIDPDPQSLDRFARHEWQSL